MIAILPFILLIVTCKAQYGHIAPPSPTPPSSYAFAAPEEVLCKHEVQSQRPKNITNTHKSPQSNKTIDEHLASTASPQQPLGLETLYGPPTTSSTALTSTAISATSKHEVLAPSAEIMSQYFSQHKNMSKPLQPARLPPHTPITGPAQPNTEHARGMGALKIPSPADPYQITPAKCEKDALFVIDSTSSVRRYFEDHRAYAVEVIKAILPDDDQTTRIGVIEYSSSLRRKIKLPFQAHKNRTQVINTVSKLPFFAGITATGAALDLALNVLQERRPNAITNVIIITDGFSYDLVDEPAARLHQLPNVRTFVVVVTDAWREYELKVIAGDASRVFKGRNSVQDLVKVLKSCT